MIDQASQAAIDGATRYVANLELIAALRELQKQLRAHIKLDVRKHYSLMVADAAASTAIHKAEGN